jgi:hypothetical protein
MHNQASASSSLINESCPSFVPMDIPTLMTELQLRGFGQEKVDAALRCLVHVHAVQDFTSGEKGGVLVEDIVNTYPVEVVQAASELFLEKTKSDAQLVYRVRWGYDDAASKMEQQLWDNSSPRWEEFVSNVNERYLGYLLPKEQDSERVLTDWKLRKDLKWFSTAIPRHGWNILRQMDDIAAIAWKLDLAFGFRPYGKQGVRGARVLLHEKAFEALRNRAATPPEGFQKAVGLWKFFSEYDAEATDFVALMRECDLSLEDVAAQVDIFFEKNLTTRYRSAQYPPYFVNQKVKKEFLLEVRLLLAPLDAWLSGTNMAMAEASQPASQAESGIDRSDESPS